MSDKVLEIALQIENNLDDLKDNGIFYKSFELYGASSSILGCYAGIKLSLMAADESVYNELDANMRDVFGSDIVDACDDFSISKIATASSQWTNDYVIARQAIESTSEYRDLFYVVMNANLVAYELVNDPDHKDDVDILCQKYQAGMNTDTPGLFSIQAAAHRVMVQEFGEYFVNTLEQSNAQTYDDVLQDIVQEYQDTHVAAGSNDIVDDQISNAAESTHESKRRVNPDPILVQQEEEDGPSYD